MIGNIIRFLSIVFLSTVFSSCGEDDTGTGMAPLEKVRTNYVRLGNVSITSGGSVPNADKFFIGFSKEIELNNSDFSLTHDNSQLTFTLSQDQNREVILTPTQNLEDGEDYILALSASLKAKDGSTFDGQSFSFKISKDPLLVTSFKQNEIELSGANLNKEIPLNPEFKIQFSHPLQVSDVRANIEITPQSNVGLIVTGEDEMTFKVSFQDELEYWKKYSLQVKSDLGVSVDREFMPVSYQLFTTHDPTLKFDEIPDEQLLTLIQEQTFKYFWDFGHPVSGMARERNTSGNTVTTGGTGFGLMAMVSAVERGFITRAEGIERWEKVVNFLETADRFHGAWPHWLNGETGSVIPFSANDDGADLVETAFLIQGLLTVKAYLNSAEPQENAIIQKINTLWREVEWTWFQQDNQDVLYWHWSPNFGWQKNLKISGHNETQMVYILAASSPTFPIEKEVYTNGYARNGNFQNGNSYYDIQLPLGPEKGGPLFFSHYSYLGLDPRNLQDQYANYWEQNVNHTKVNYEYCKDNPQNYVGYSMSCWGLTASDSSNGYSAHSPNNDLGVITPTAAVSALPYSPDESMQAIRFFYYVIGDRIWGEYGFIDAFSPQDEWYASSYLAIDQGPIITMIENYRTGLLWSLFMSDTDVRSGLDKLEFNY